MKITTSSSFSGALTVSESLILKSAASSLTANVTLAYKGRPFVLTIETNQAYVCPSLLVNRELCADCNIQADQCCD